MKLLDLYCGVGGASDGYSNAGFEVTGVDWRPQVRYPYPFIQAEAREFLREGGASGYDLIHASPPCQGYVDGHPRGWLYDARYEAGGRFERQIPELRALLNHVGIDWVMENVDTAPLGTGRGNGGNGGGKGNGGGSGGAGSSVLLCGTFFEGLRVIRHRVFELGGWSMPMCSVLGSYLCFCESLRSGKRKRIGEGGWVTVAGGAGGKIGTGEYGSSALVAAKAMGMEEGRGTYAELKECVPPRYTELIGKQWIEFFGS